VLALQGGRIHDEGGGVADDAGGMLDRFVFGVDYVGKLPGGFVFVAGIGPVVGPLGAV
jgi:hypothetical protein